MEWKLSWVEARERTDFPADLTVDAAWWGSTREGEIDRYKAIWQPRAAPCLSLTASSEELPGLYELDLQGGRWGQLPKPQRGININLSFWAAVTKTHSQRAALSRYKAAFSRICTDKEKTNKKNQTWVFKSRHPCSKCQHRNRKAQIYLVLKTYSCPIVGGLFWGEHQCNVWVKSSIPWWHQVFGMYPESCSLSTYLVLPGLSPGSRWGPHQWFDQCRWYPSSWHPPRKLFHRDLSHHGAYCYYTFKDVCNWNSAHNKTLYLIYKRESCYFPPYTCILVIFCAVL